VCQPGRMIVVIMTMSICVCCYFCHRFLEFGKWMSPLLTGRLDLHDSFRIL